MKSRVSMKTIFQETESEQKIQKWRDPVIQGLVITDTSETRSRKVMATEQYRVTDGWSWNKRKQAEMSMHQ